MKRMVFVSAFTALLSVRTDGQEMRFFYPAPQPSQIRVTKNVSYGPLQMDVYQPADRKGERLPVLILFHVAAGEHRDSPFIRRWAELAASQGLVAVQPDLHDDKLESDFDAAVAHLISNAGMLGIDPDRIAVYAGSGNVSSALPVVMNPTRTAVKAAVMYYGAATVSEFRPDLPLLIVRAGLDRPPVNRMLAELVSRAIAQNAPVTIVNYSGGHHAFEIFDDAAVTRAVIDRTIAFVKEATGVNFQASIRAGTPFAMAAAHVIAGRYDKAAALYAELVKAAPDDPPLRLSYGEALLGAGRFGDACDEFNKLKGKRLGPRDLGIPAAHACMQKGDADAAIGWLQSIPKRFRSSELQQDPVFAPIRNRADFIELFRPE